MSPPEQEAQDAAPQDEQAAARTQRVEAALDELAAFLRTGASDGWVRVDLAARLVADAAEADVHESLGDGSTSPAAVAEPELFGLLRELREAMYDPDDDGAWFSLRLYAVPGDGRWLAVNHFGEPAWRVPPPDEKYREDLERYPREYSELPDWLSAKVEQT